MCPHDLRLRLTLEVERGAEPIAGRLSDTSDRQWWFVGWVQLTTALEEALAVNGAVGDHADDGGRPRA